MLLLSAAASAKSIVLSASWYVAVIPVSVLLENIAPVVSEINSASVVPSTVIASAGTREEKEEKEEEKIIILW